MQWTIHTAMLSLAVETFAGLTNTLGGSADATLATAGDKTTATCLTSLPPSGSGDPDNMSIIFDNGSTKDTELGLELKDSDDRVNAHVSGKQLDVTRSDSTIISQYTSETAFDPGRGSVTTVVSAPFEIPSETFTVPTTLSPPFCETSGWCTLMASCSAYFPTGYIQCFPSTTTPLPAHPITTISSSPSIRGSFDVDSSAGMAGLPDTT